MMGVQEEGTHRDRKKRFVTAKRTLKKGSLPKRLGSSGVPMDQRHSNPPGPHTNCPRKPGLPPERDQPPPRKNKGNVEAVRQRTCQYTGGV